MISMLAILCRSSINRLDGSRKSAFANFAMPYHANAPEWRATMTKLHQWYIDEHVGFNEEKEEVVYQAHGIVTGHNRLRDNSNIHTTAIKEVNISEEQEMVILQTKNTVYYCDLKECDYSRQSTSLYIPDFYKYAAIYGKESEKEYEVEDNSVLLVSSDKEMDFWKRAFYKHHGKLQKLTTERYWNICPRVLNVLNRNHAECPEETIDIRFIPREGNNVRDIYLLYIPEGFALYVENIGKEKIYMQLPYGYIEIPAGERKRLCEDNANPVIDSLEALRDLQDVAVTFL